MVHSKKEIKQQKTQQSRTVKSVSPQGIPHTRSVVNQAFGVLCLCQLTEIWPLNISQQLMSPIFFLSLIRIILKTHKYVVMNISNYDYVTIIWVRDLAD